MKTIERAGLAAAGFGTIFAIGSGLNAIDNLQHDLLYGPRNNEIPAECAPGVGATAVAAECEQYEDTYQGRPGDIMQSIALDGMLFYGIAEGVAFVRRRPPVISQPEFSE